MRLTIVNQFYAPDISPTAQLAASLAEHRAGIGDDVTVITGRAGYLESLAPSRDVPTSARLRIRRAWTPHLGKSTLWRRLLGYVTFLVGATVRLLSSRRQDVVVSMTTPPLLVTSALLHKILHPSTRVILWSMDCYPDAAERFGELRIGGPISRAQRTLNRWAFRRIDHVVALDGAMRELLESQYATRPEVPRFSVIPNWERRTSYPTVDAVRPWEGYASLDVGDRTIVLYLGNTGVGHRFDTVLDAAGVADDVLFLFVGGGARWADLSGEVDRRRLENVVLHPYVPKDQTPAVMAGAHGGLITLDDRSLGVMSPSKLHANLAAGLPIVYVGPVGSNVDEAIQATGCGTSLRHGDVDGLVEAVRSLRRDPGARERSRRAFEAHYADDVTLAQWDKVIDDA